MHKRTAHRWRLSAMLFGFTFLAFGSFWLLQVMENSDNGVRADALKNEPDYIVDNFSFVRMTPGGKPRYVITGEKLTHRPVDDSAEVEQPIVKSITSEQPPMTITSKHGVIDHGNTRVHLTGDVDIVRVPSATSGRMHLTTQALTIFPDEDKMRTDQPVVMTSDGSTMTGTGLFVDNAAGVMEMASKVHITYPPPRR